MGNCLKKNKKITMEVEVNTTGTCPVTCFDDDTCVSSCCNININKTQSPKSVEPSATNPSLTPTTDIKL